VVENFGSGMVCGLWFELVWFWWVCLPLWMSVVAVVVVVVGIGRGVHLCESGTLRVCVCVCVFDNFCREKKQNTVVLYVRIPPYLDRKCGKTDQCTCIMWETDQCNVGKQTPSEVFVVRTRLSLTVPPGLQLVR